MNSDPTQHDDDVDTALRTWAHAARSAAPAVSLPDLAAQRPALARRHLLAAVVLTSVLMLAVLISVGVPHYLHRNAASTPVPSVAGVTSVATPVQGKHVITFHGLTLTVPAAWQIGIGEPCAFATNTVVLPGTSADCGHAATPHLTIVEFYENALPTGISITAGPIPITIDGVHATRTDYTYNALPAFGITVAALHASILFRPAQGTTGQDLADTLHIDAVDINGCTAHTGDVGALPRNQQPDRPGADAQLIPADPRSLIVCRYAAGWLEQGAHLDSGELDSVVAVLNALPSGVTIADPNTYLPLLCKTPTSLGSLDGLTATDSQAYRIQADYPSGHSVIIIARLAQCGDLGASNGTRTGKITRALWQELIKLAGNPGSIVTG